MKSGIVAVYGRANVGKSTLINRCLGFKLLAVSSKPQTTRDNIHAIYNDEDSQIVFTDSPGVFRPHGKLGSILLRDADCFNKVDLVHANIGEERLNRYLCNLPKNTEVVRMSCKDGFGVDTFLSTVKKYLPEGEPIYPRDMVSDRPKEYVIAEMIREKCLRLLKAEVPHSIYIDVRQIDSEDKGWTVYADIIVEKESEKAIVIGRNGKMISKIRQYSEQSIASYFGLKTVVDLHVKCIPNWREQDRYLRQFGYES